MLIQLLILLISVLDTNGLRNSPKDSLIDWNSNRKLSWEDFKAQPDGSSVNAALTSTNINIDYSFNSRDFKYKIKCQFDPSKSWGRIKNDYILSHEQAHFDIAEIHARLLHKALKNYRFNAKSANKDIGEIYQKYMKEHHEMQEKYDDETNYSRNESQQKEWFKKIDSTLKNLESFAQYK
jgi:predicted secreted Zn-dependent protease